MMSANDNLHADSTGTVLESLFAYIIKLLMQAVFSLHLLLFAGQSYHSARLLSQ